jgi:hypothetical protein
MKGFLRSLLPTYDDLHPVYNDRDFKKNVEKKLKKKRKPYVLQLGHQGGHQFEHAHEFTADGSRCSKGAIAPIE